MILFDILQFIDDFEEIELYYGHKYNYSFIFTGTKNEFIYNNDLVNYKNKKIKGIYPSLECKLGIILIKEKLRDE